MRHSAANFSLQSFKRSEGRSATAGAAYRHGVVIEDERTGQTHDYTKKQGVESQGLVNWNGDVASLWNAAEQAETRKNSQVAREWTISLPNELSPEASKRLVETYSQWLADEHNIALSWAIHDTHKPKKNEPDHKKQNRHCHLMGTTREVENNTFGQKTRHLDVIQTSRPAVQKMRDTWAEMANAELVKAGYEPTISLDSNEKMEAKKQAPKLNKTEKLGPAKTAMMRRYYRDAREARAAGKKPPEKPRFLVEHEKTKNKNDVAKVRWKEAQKPKQRHVDPKPIETPQKPIEPAPQPQKQVVATNPPEPRPDRPERPKTLVSDLRAGLAALDRQKADEVKAQPQPKPQPVLSKNPTPAPRPKAGIEKRRKVAAQRLAAPILARQAARAFEKTLKDLEPDDQIRE